MGRVRPNSFTAACEISVALVPISSRNCFFLPLISTGTVIKSLAGTSCNSADAAIARSVHIPVLDMIGLSIERLAAAAPRPRRIGLLASPAVRLVGLYQKQIEQAGMVAIFPDPDHESRLLGVIKAVKSGQFGAAHEQDYEAVTQNLLDAGADALLIACTELSVIGPPANATCPVVDSLDVLVEATIATARA